MGMWREQYILDPEYKTILRRQVKAMMDQGSNLAVWTELNDNWFNWLERDFQRNPDFRGWKLYHDGLGVAIMHGPEIVAAKDLPNAVRV